MYSVSADFLTQMRKAQRVEHVRGTIDSIPFTDRNIISLSYTNRCSDTKDVTFGSAYIGQIEAQFVNILITRGSWRGKVINLEYGLELENETVEWLPIGVFIITQAEWSDLGIKVSACDCISQLDKPFNISTTSGKLYGMLKLASTNTGVTLGRSQAEIEALPNGTDTLGLYENNDITTYRDFVSWIACTLGGFATADRDGNLTVRSWSESSVVFDYDYNERITGSIFSDYTTLYDGISIANIADNTMSYYSAGGGYGATIPIGANPLLQYGTTDARDLERQRLAVVANNIQYTPFNISVLNCPVFDLGDLIECTGGVAGLGTLTCCVMSIEWQFKHAMSIEGFGADPNLYQSKSRADKALNGLKSKVNESDMVIHTFINSESLELDDSVETEIAKIHFATLKNKKVTMWHEVNLDLEITDPTGLATCQAFYYINGELEAYSPITTWSEEGKHILPLMYFMETTTSGESYDWVVKLEINGGSATIDTGDVHIILEGQGLVALDQFDGLIEIEEIYTPITPDVEHVELIETCTLDANIGVSDLTGLTDTYTPIEANAQIITIIDDDPNTIIQLYGVTADRITESDDVRVTENGDHRITDNI